MVPTQTPEEPELWVKERSSNPNPQSSKPETERRQLRQAMARTAKKPAKKPDKQSTAAQDERWLHFYRQMLKIRLFKEEVNQLYLGAKMPGWRIYI